MRDFVIMADVNTDIAEEYAQKENIAIFPQYYHFNDGTIYGDEIKLTSGEFYARLQNEQAYSMGCNPDRVHGIMEEALKKDLDIIAVMASSDCSGSYSTVVNEAEELMQQYEGSRIHVIDSRVESVPMWIMIDRGLKAKKQGASFDEVVHAMEEMIEGSNAFFIVDDLKYLVRGGRVSALSGLVGTMLSIKPLLYFKDGLITSFAKVRGKKAAKKHLLEELKQMDLYEYCCVAHTANLEDAQEFAAELESELHVKVLGISELSLIIGTHTGPGALGVAFWNRKKEQ